MVCFVVWSTSLHCYWLRMVSGDWETIQVGWNVARPWTWPSKTLGNSLVRERKRDWPGDFVLDEFDREAALAHRYEGVLDEGFVHVRLQLKCTKRVYFLQRWVVRWFFSRRKAIWTNGLGDSKLKSVLKSESWRAINTASCCGFMLLWIAVVTVHAWTALTVTW